MKKSKNLLCSYDESQIAENEFQNMKSDPTYYGIEEMTDEQIRNRIYSDPLIYEIEYDFVFDTLTEWINSKNTTNFKATVENFGWRNLSGFKEFTANNGKDFLYEILPDTQCTFYIYKHYSGLKIINYHHDSPTGETYIIKPNYE